MSGPDGHPFHCEHGTGGTSRGDSHQPSRDPVIHQVRTNSLLYVLPSMLPCTYLETFARGNFHELPAELKFRFFIFANISKYTVLRHCVIKSRHVIVRTTTHKVLCWLMCRGQQLVVATSWNEQHLNSSCWVGMVKKGATLRLQVV